MAGESSRAVQDLEAELAKQRAVVKDDEARDARRVRVHATATVERGVNRMDYTWDSPRIGSPEGGLHLGHRGARQYVAVTTSSTFFRMWR